MSIVEPIIIPAPTAPAASPTEPTGTSTRVDPPADLMAQVAACEVVVGLAIIMTIFRTRRSASVDAASLLKQ